MTPVTVLVIPAGVVVIPPGGENGAALALAVSGTESQQFAAIRAQVGGDVQTIGGRYLGADWIAFANEEGKLRGLPLNERATALVQLLGWNSRPGDYLVGTVVLAGKNASVPAEVVRAARESGLAVLGPDAEQYDEEAVP
jgi:hypothetical protein